MSSRRLRLPASNIRQFAPTPHLVDGLPVCRAGRRICALRCNEARDPQDRTTDCTLAALGLFDDAAPLFAPVEKLAKAGVLLAIPA